MPDVALPPTVFAQERQERIVGLLAEEGRVVVADLAARFGVSTVTIRKDLAALEAEARLARTHGGAIAARSAAAAEPGFEVRDRLQRAQKAAIGVAAIALIGDGESIAFDASTTALYAAREIPGRDWQHLTVVTNSIRIALELAGTAGVTVVMLGGRVRPEALSVVGPLGDGVFRRVNIGKAFVGAIGLTVDLGLTDATEEEAQIKRSMVAAAREVFALVDHTKWGRAAAATFCRTERLTAVVTDSEAPAEMVAGLRARGARVILAEAGNAG